MYVALVAGRVVGYSAISGGRVSAVYVRPRYVGRGVGARLLRVVESVARRKRVRRLELASSVNAIPFYRRHGYRLTRWSSYTFRQSGVSIRCAYMRKSLGKVTK